MKTIPVLLFNSVSHAWGVVTLTVAVFSTVLLGGVSVQAATYLWTSANSDGYTNQLDWSPAGLPGILDTAVIGNATQPNGSVVYTNLPPDPASTNLLSLLQMGTASGSSTFNMSGGVLLITNSSGTALSLGDGSGAIDTFTQNGGTLVVARPSTANLYYQDGFLPGDAAGGNGAFTINNGLLMILCGCEVGAAGSGTFNLNGGTVVDNGWFGLRGIGTSSDSGVLDMTGGTLYVLRNTEIEGQSYRPLCLGQASTGSSTANISGGTAYFESITFANYAVNETLNMSGGTLYIGAYDVQSRGAVAGGSQTINISGGTFHTADMQIISTTANCGNTNTILSDGVNWWWDAHLPVNLTNSTFTVNGVSGPGYVTFAPEATRTITLSNIWSGVGGMTMNGPGTLLMPNTTNQIQFTGPLTVNGGTFTSNGTNTIGAVNLAGGTLTLNGANTINGAVALSGGMMALNVANTINGAVNLTGGALALNAAQNDTGGVTVNSGTLQFNDGGSVIDPTITVGSGGTINFNGSAPITFTNNIAGAGNVLVTQAASTSAVNATGNLTYSGSTFISQGIFQVTGLPNTSSVIVTNTGTLASSGVIHATITVYTNASLYVGTTSQAGTLNASNVVLNNGSTFYVKIGTATTPGGGTNDLLVCSNLTIGANSIMSIDPVETPLSIGTYIIVKYSGALTGTFGKLSGPSGMSLNYSTPGEIQLVVTSITPANLTWAALIGAANINWDVETSSNWTNTATSSLDTFHQLDDVTFNSAPGTTNQVNVSAAVTPTSVTISGGFNYLFSGLGHISGSASITDNGTGTNVIDTSGNNYTGPVQINSGVLQVGIGGSSWLGTTNSGTTVAPGGTLDLNGQAIGLEAISISGTGSSGQGALYNSYTAGATLQNLSLGNNATVSSGGGSITVNDTIGGQVQGNGFALTEIGSGTLQFNNTDAQGYGSGNGLGNINIQGGLFSLQGYSSLGNPAGNLTVQNATVSFNAVTNLGDVVHGGLNKNLVLNNGAVDSGGASNNFIGPVSLAGSGNTIGLRADLHLWSSISGSGSVTIGPDALGAGGGTLWLEGTNTYSGSTLLTAGKIALGTNASLQNSSLIQLDPGTILDASAAGGLNLNSGQTLGGFGTVISNVIAGVGSAISPGSSVTAGTLVLTNNLTLNGDINIIKLSGNPAQTGGPNDLLSVGGALTLSGNSTIEVVPIAALSSSQPYIVMQSGSLTGSAGNLTAVSASPRYSVSAVTSGNNVEINASGSPAQLKWYGNVPGQVGIWASGTTNWINMGTAQYDAFYDGDNPTFDDSSTVTSVSIPNGVVPSGIYMSNVANTYTFTGGGGIGGTLNMEGNGNGKGGTLVLAMSNAPSFTGIDSSAGTLVYDLHGMTNYIVAAQITDNLGNGNGNVIFGGTNTAILEGNNAYDAFADHPAFYGTFWVTNGVLEYTNVDALGADASVSGNPGFSPLIVTNNGTLNFNGVPAGTSLTAGIGGEKWIHISGSGYNGQGALTDSGGNGEPSGAFCNLYLDANATMGSVTNVRYDQHVLSGNAQQVEGNGFNLTFTGAGYLFFYGQADGDTHFGNIDVASIVPGRLVFQDGPVALGITTNYLFVESNAMVGFYAVTNPIDPVHNGLDKIMWLKGDASVDSGGVSNNFIGPVFLSGANLIGTRSALSLWGGIMDSNGPGGFILGNDAVGASGAALWLEGTNSYSGPTIVSNETLYVGANSSLGLSTYVQVNSGATLNLSAMPGYNFGTTLTNQTMSGNGTVVGPAGGNLTFSAGGSLAVGLPPVIGLPITNPSTLTMNGNVVFNAGSTNYIVANKTSPIAGSVPVGEVTGLTSLTLGGMLVITNYGTSFVAGDSLKLFNATTYATNAYTIIPATPGPNLAWNISSIPVSGTLSVVSTLTINPNPTNIVFSVKGGNLTLSWPGDHLGWTLQSQTNRLSVGISTNWTTVSGSSSVTNVVIPINLTNGSVFYRLTY